MRMIISRSRRKAVSLIEMLVAVTIVMIFMTGAIVAFVEIIRANDRSQATLDAVSNARTALDIMSLEIKRARFGPPSNATTTATLFNGLTEDLVSGNFIDDDGDGSVDEEVLGGNAASADQDLDWTNPDDKHALITTSTTERPQYVNFPDKDDGHIDEDVRFTSATLTFRTFPLPGDNNSLREVTYTIGTWDGEDNVLLQQIRTYPEKPDVNIGPIAHNVVSFGLLFWDPEAAAAIPPNQPWRKDWSVIDFIPVTMPPSVYISITTYAGTPLPLSQVPAGQPLRTVTLDTMVNIEAVINDPAYTALRPSTPYP